MCHSWHFLDINFKFDPKVCNGCLDLKQKVMSFNDVTIISVKENDNRVYFWYMVKDEAINLLRKADLTEKIENS